jgi:hypothetical protein
MFIIEKNCLGEATKKKKRQIHGNIEISLFSYKYNKKFYDLYFSLNTSISLNDVQK